MSPTKPLLENILEIISDIRTILKTSLMEDSYLLAKDKENQKLFHEKMNESIREYFEKANPLKFYKKAKL